MQAIVPTTGPAMPVKSDKSPVFKLKSFSSIIVLFRFVTEPSSRFVVLVNPNCSKP